MNDKPEFFKKNKYIVVENALSKDAAKIIGNTLLISEANEEMAPDDAQVIGASCKYSLSVMEATLLHLHKTVENNTGLDLQPTYSFTRIYRAGDILVKHTDRESCEISATITLNFKANDLWPICVKTVDGEDKEIPLEIGNLMIYRGQEIEHWREEFKGDLWMQVFVHYVDKNGPNYPEFSFDKRQGKIPGLYSFIMESM